MQLIMERQHLLFDLIKNGICRYIHVPLQCNKDDIIRLSLGIEKLIDDKNYSDISWYGIFTRNLRCDRYNDVSNLITYIRNHFLL